MDWLAGSSVTTRLDKPGCLLIALGGNAILRRGDDGSIDTQYQRADEVMARVADLAGTGMPLVLTHGNGPIVGNIVLRNEAARSTVPPMPLYIADADSEGGIGLMLQMSLHNALHVANVDRGVVTVVTQVVVDPEDPAFLKPSKPIGPYYSAEELDVLKAAEPSWRFVEVPGCGWRRVVPSPEPKRIVEAEVVRRLMVSGDIVIAAGGGGVPVREHPDLHFTGVDAVIDKDRASALLALQIGTDVLVILMEAERVYRGWGTDSAEAIERLTLSQARAMLDSGELDAGSIGPKVSACEHFVRASGRDAIICRAEDLEAALAGEAGTRVVAG
jgi:carbamate kinase